MIHCEILNFAISGGLTPYVQAVALAY